MAPKDWLHRYNNHLFISRSSKTHSHSVVSLILAEYDKLVERKERERQGITETYYTVLTSGERKKGKERISC